MGNSASSSGRGQHEQTVDFGYLTPQGVYTAPRDYDQAVVSELICARRLAPFYRPLEEYDESWNEDRILAARKELLDPDGNPEPTPSRPEPTYPNGGARATHPKRSSLQKEQSKPEAAIYRGAVECPICFLVSCTSSSCSPLPQLRHARSTTRQTSTTRDVVTKRYVLNALFK
jgi:hypothetical protein